MQSQSRRHFGLGAALPPSSYFETLLFASFFKIKVWDFIIFNDPAQFQN